MGVQYCTALYSTVQYCTVLYSTVQYVFVWVSGFLGLQNFLTFLFDFLIFSKWIFQTFFVADFPDSDFEFLDFFQKEFLDFGPSECPDLAVDPTQGPQRSSHSAVSAISFWVL